MKHPVLYFAALLGGGLALLAWLDSLEPPIAGVGPSDSALRREPSPTGTRPKYALEGAIESTQFHDAADGGRGGRRYQLFAQGQGQTATGDLKLSDLSIDLFDPETDAGVGRIEAGTAEIGVKPGADIVEMSLSNEAELRDVHINVVAGTRFAPLTIETASAHGDLDAQRFWTPKRATARGTDINASGEGLEFDLQQGLIVFARDGTAAIVTRDARTARVHARGELVWLQAPGIGARPMRVTASERARLALSGPEGLSLSANTVELVGSADPEREATFRFQELSARGEVVLLLGGNEFRCAEARFVLGAAGTLERVRLVGTVVGELELTDFTLATDPTAPIAKEATVPTGRIALWGRGPMDLRVGDDGRFDLAGPTELVWEDTRLWAEGGLTGKPSRAGAPLSFEAWSGVRVEHAGWTVRTETLTGSWKKGVGGATAAVLRAPNGARADGFDDGGAPVALRSRSGFEIDIDGATWRVPRAGGVDLSVGGERPLTATADLVKDFFDDPLLGPSFSASEHVEVIVDGQFLRGERLDVKGLDDLLVESSDEPVTVDGPGLHAAARSLRRVGDTLIADGDVSARVERDDLKIDLQAKHLEVSGPLEVVDERPLRVRATGAVHAEVDLRGTASPDGVATMNHLEVDTPDLEVVRRALPNSPFDETVVRGRGGVVAKVRGDFGSHDINARELNALLVDRMRTAEDAVRATSAGSDARIAAEADREVARLDLRGSVEGRGDVAVVSLAPTAISGHGDTFVVDQDGLGRLVANPGKRVDAQGTLPGSLQPFDVVAASIEFSRERLDALETRIHVGDPLSQTSIQSKSKMLVDLIATARRVHAVADSIVFEEDVSFLGTTGSLETFTLRCAQSKITTDPPLPGETRRQPRDLTATGGVRIVFSRGLDVEGDQLVARAFDQSVRIDGTPAQLRQNQRDYTASYFEIDTVNMLWEAGDVVIKPSGSGEPASGGERP